MNEKEMNQAILAELKRIANEVFAKVKVSKEGTYTAAELWNGKNSFGEKIEIFYMGTSSGVYTAKVDTFEFKVSAKDVFLRLWKFERLCNVKQTDKMRFTYGNQEGENIAGKTMYLDKYGKATVRKKNLVKLSERVAIEPDKKTKSYNMYYFASGLWYLIALNFDESQYKAIKERIEKDENYLFNLLQRWDFNTENRLNPIYKALFEALKSERNKHTPEQRKHENEPENTVIREVVTSRTNYGVLRVEQRELKSIGNSLYKDNKNLYFLYDSFCYCLGGYTRGVATFLKEQGNNIQNNIRGMIEQGGISTDSAKIMYEEMRKNDAPQKSESVQKTNEDYPPEPYNKEKSENVASLATFKTRNVATSNERFQDRTICGRFQKNMRPNYLRQKVFTTELFYARLKISRFKQRYFVRYTNYHLCEESALERKRNSNTSVYMALIRGETEIGS